MTAVNKLFINYEAFKIFKEIDQNPAWYGRLPDREAEELLKGQSQYTYLLRSSDLPNQFFLSFIQSDLSLEHRAIGRLDKGWFFQNGDVHRSSSYLALIPEIMHCSFQQCRPLVKYSEGKLNSRV
jgi:hypothetical protein